MDGDVIILKLTRERQKPWDGCILNVCDEICSGNNSNLSVFFFF